MQQKPKLRNALTVSWKDSYNKPAQETFKKIKTLEQAKSILAKRNNSSIRIAIWYDNNSKETILPLVDETPAGRYGQNKFVTPYWPL